MLPKIQSKKKIVNSPVIKSVKPKTLLNKVEEATTIEHLIDIKEIKMFINGVRISSYGDFFELTVGVSGLKYNDDDGMYLQVFTNKDRTSAYLIEQPSTCANTFMHRINSNRTQDTAYLVLYKLGIFAAREAGYTHLLFTHHNTGTAVKLAIKYGWTKLRDYINKRTSTALADMSYNL